MEKLGGTLIQQLETIFPLSGKAKGEEVVGEGRTSTGRGKGEDERKIKEGVFWSILKSKA